MKDLSELILGLNWPQVSLLLGILFLIMFRKEVSSFLTRVKSVGRDGVLTNSEPIPQLQSENSTKILQYIEIEKTVLLDEVENNIIDDLKSRGLEFESDTIKVLVRNLAVTNINLEHEKTYNVIFGSQIWLLKKLNETSGAGRSVTYVDSFYKDLQSRNSGGLEDWTLEDYLGYLKGRSLLTFENEKWHITHAGQDFLLWLVKNGKQEDRLN